MNGNKPLLSVIIPAYNEEKTIGETLLSIDKYLSKQNYDYEIIVEADGSKDKTVEVARNFQKMVKNLIVYDNQPNHGKGWVVKKGMLEAKGDFRMFMDADNATTIDHMEKAWPFLKQDYEVAIGTRDSRDHKDAQQAVPQSFFKRTLGDVGNILIQILVLWGIWDTQCGFKVFSAKAAQEIFSKMTIDRWGWDIEALSLAKAMGYKIGKFPVYWINNPYSRVKLSTYLKVFVELFEVKINLMTDKYGIKKQQTKV